MVVPDTPQEFTKYHEEEMKDPDGLNEPHPDADPLHDYTHNKPE